MSLSGSSPSLGGGVSSDFGRVWYGVMDAFAALKWEG